MVPITRRIAGVLFAAASVLGSGLTRAQDLSIAEPGGRFHAPVSGVSLTSFESVTVRIFNHGSPLPAGTMFNVSYVVNGGAPVVEMVVLASFMPSNTSMVYTFTTPANLSMPGTYTLAASVSLPGDTTPQNDAHHGYQVENVAASVGGTLAGGGAGTLTLSGHTGSVVHWERSLDGGLTWNVLANTTTALAFPGADHRELYRVQVSNHGAPPAYSSVVDTGVAP